MLELSSAPPTAGPAACIKCGATVGLSRYKYERTYTPRWLYIGLVFGLIPAALLMLIISRKHQIMVYFCAACRNRYRIATLVSYLLAIPCLLLLLLGPVFGLAHHSWYLGIGGVAMAIGIAVIIDRYSNSASPRPVLLNEKSIVFDIPRHGLADMANVKF